MRVVTNRRRMWDVWHSMIWRCHVESHISYPNYGAKGITVCRRWRKSFDAFIQDVGIIPIGMQLDRINGKLGYKPSNVRFVTPRQNSLNKTNIVWLTYMGRTQCMTHWASEVGMSVYALHWRLKAGWPIEKALTSPIRKVHP